MTSRRRWIFAAIVALVATMATAAVLLAADLWAHHRAARTAGVNRRGYRGPVVGRAGPGERRIVTLGGSTVFGYGVFVNEALPAQLEDVLRARGLAVSVVNLGFNSEGAYAFAPTIRDYAALAPDVVVLYEGYNDLLPDYPNRLLARHGSPVFRLTGYFPILPIVLRDKADALAKRRDPSKAVFGAAAGAVDTLAKEIGRLAPDDLSAASATASTTAPQRWSFYCDAVAAGVRAARGIGASVLVVTQPYISERHVEQQRALRSALAQFRDDAGVAYFDAGRVIDLANQQLAFDGMHLTTQGNRVMASALAPEIARLVSHGTE